MIKVYTGNDEGLPEGVKDFYWTFQCSCGFIFADEAEFEIRSAKWADFLMCPKCGKETMDESRAIKAARPVKKTLQQIADEKDGEHHHFMP